MSEEMTIAEYKAYKCKSKNKSKTKDAAFRFWENCLREKGFTKVQDHKLLQHNEYGYEFKFSKDRKFRADMVFATNKYLWLVEYHGLVLRNNKAVKSGHQTPSGFTKDCEKANLATIIGYRCLSYTALNYKEFEHDLEKIV